MKTRILFSLTAFFLLWGHGVYAEISTDDLMNHTKSDITILKDASLGITGILSLIQSILLKLVLPIIVVGAAIYIAYQLFTAEGDEMKMKKAWKSVAYSGIALVAIALSYAIVSVLSTLSL